MTPRVLVVFRSLQRSHGGMQLYARTFVAGLRSRQDFSSSVCGFGGSAVLLPVFFCVAFVRCVVWTGTHVHLGDAVLSPLLPVLRLLRPGLRLSITVYGLDLTYPVGAYRWMLRRSLPSAHRIVAISRATADAAARLGVERTAIIVIPCGIDIPDTPLPELHRDIVTILLLGRQILRKGTRWFLREVLPELQKSLPNVRVIIAGSGPEMPGILSDMTHLRLTAYVSAPGSVSDAEKQKLYETATVFLMPNIAVKDDMEGFGLVAVEAAAAGLPVVAAEIDGIRDAVIPDVTGQFFRSGDAADCIRSIKNIMMKKWHHEAMRDACRRGFSTEIIISSYVAHVFR